MASAESEQAELMQEDAVPEANDAPRTHSNKRRLVVGGLLVLGLATALLVWKAFRPCVPAMDEDSVVSLVAEEDASELGSMVIDPSESAAITKEWLRMAHEAATKGKETDLDPKVEAKFDEMERQLKKDHKKHGPKVLKNVMKKSTRALISRRKKLNKFIDQLSGRYKKNETNGKKGEKYKDTWGAKAKVASCVFDSFSAVTTVAKVALNFNDAMKTCHGVTLKGIMSFNNSQAIHTKVCSINSFAILGGVVGLATTLASAANDCAVTTSLPNVNAMCSAAITGLITGIAGVGGSAILINAACKPKGWYHNINQSTRPSDVGSNWRYEQRLDGERRLRGSEEVPVESESAPPRKLLFGGGIESTHGHCALESMSTMWSLASAALAINAAAHQGDDKDCPPVNAVTKSKKAPKGYGFMALPYRIPQALCAVDVFSALVGFLGAISFMQLIAVQCTNVLNLAATCGTGVTGMTTAMAGLGQAITGIWLACDLAQLPIIHPALMGIRGVDVISGGMLSDAIAGHSMAPNLPFTGESARRLEEQKDHAKVAMKVVDHLKSEVMKHFKTPEDVFMYLGYNFSDSTAAWRNGPEDQMDLSHLSSLVEETTQKVKEGGLFGSAATCKE